MPKQKSNNNNTNSHGEEILAVFDLDYTIWDPEMYQLWGQPKFVDAPKNMKNSDREATKTIQEGMVLADRNGSIMKVFPGASSALAEIQRLQADGFAIRAAVASKTDEPDYAMFCMQNLVIDCNKGDDNTTTTLLECFDKNLIEISYGDKTNHFRRLHSKTGIPYEQMMFFDNERWNITSVSKLGVKCFYTPNGMQINHWNDAKKMFGLS